MTWLDKAVALAKQFEGCRLEAYPDPVHGWKVATIGYGATGPSIVEGTVWTQEQAEADLIARMTGCGEMIDRLVTVPLNDEPKAALADFVYNEGEGNLARSTLLDKLNAGDMQGAADQFSRWDEAGDEVLNGLVRRRDAERALFLLGADLSGETHDLSDTIAPPGETEPAGESQPEVQS